MTPSARRALGIVLSASMIVGSGCGSGKNDNQPNPELKIPEVKPSRRGASMGALKDPTKEPAK